MRLLLRLVLMAKREAVAALPAAPHEHAFLVPPVDEFSVFIGVRVLSFVFDKCNIIAASSADAVSSYHAVSG